MKVGKRGLKMSSGKIYHFKSKAGRARFERVAQAIKHNPSFKRKMARKGK